MSSIIVQIISILSNNEIVFKWQKLKRSKKSKRKRERKEKWKKKDNKKIIKIKDRKFKV